MKLVLHTSWGSLAVKRPLPRKPLGAPGKEAKSDAGQVVPVPGAAPGDPQAAGTQLISLMSLPE